ncbi:FtsX-like permease family protein [Pseudoflavitalea sp. X16]|uniref:ABC transporter permease n=1 Tax=Paraflavitalea devenefica TaxID=2716334 RepID=UPI00142184CD|nr:ABC transporter permease [Paraflavitalea devenefica]NII28004.1 FtsX-like permease family protein [Paraflavitalea devenefica]
MIRNYLTIALRTLWKHRVFTAINMAGLAIGISASLVIYLLVQYDFSFDKFHKDGDRIYRIVSRFTSPDGQVHKNPGVPVPMADAVRNEVTGLQVVAPFHTWSAEKISVPDSRKAKPVVHKSPEGIIFADQHYFELLQYEWVAGSGKTALQQPNQVVLSTAGAALYFPGVKPEEVVGRELYFDDNIRCTITGIVKDLTGNTDFTFKTFISYSTLDKAGIMSGDPLSWNNTSGDSQLFIKLSPGVTAGKIETAIHTLFNKHQKPGKDDNTKTAHLLQPLQDLHFNTDYRNFDQRTAHKPTLYGLLAIAAFLLLLGIINFINLATAQSSQRAKEIGIRKTLGSLKTQLVLQFLSETFLLTLMATMLSVITTPLLLKAFSGFLPAGLHFNLVQQPGILLFLLALLIGVSILAGFYPALILSGYKPILVLKNQAYANTGKTRNAWLRKSLTVSQFVIAQVFIMATILVSKQIHYAINMDMGFRKDAIVYFSTNYRDTVRTNKKVLMNKLAAIPEVAMVSLSNNPPSGNSVWSTTMIYKDGNKPIESNVQLKYADTNYIKLFRLTLLAGQNIIQSDTASQLLINKTYAHVLGFRQPQDAVGKYIEWNNKKLPVVGVVADFHQRSLHEAIKPLAISNGTNIALTINMLLHPQNDAGTVWPAAIKKMEKAWKEFYPEMDFSASFYDEQIAQFYENEQRVSTLLIWATALTIFISCLGLLGLVMYTTSVRVKEIGVRKVLGASVTQLVALLSRDFMALVLLAFVIATPVAWLGMHQWLENFAYRTSVSAWVFVLSAAIMMIITLFTLGFQTVRAALANPVKSLRSE